MMYINVYRKYDEVLKIIQNAFNNIKRREIV